MGSRVQKIAFLIFALMFVAIMAILNTTILTMGTSANSQLTTTVTSDDSSLQIYDQGSLYGSSVVTCAKDPGKVASTDLTVFVITTADVKNSANGTEYTSADAYPHDSNVNGEINKTAKFKSYLCNNDNGVTTGILFVQEKSGATKSMAETLCAGLAIQGCDLPA